MTIRSLALAAPIAFAASAALILFAASAAWADGMCPREMQYSAQLAAASQPADAQPTNAEIATATGHGEPAETEVVTVQAAD